LFFLSFSSIIFFSMLRLHHLSSLFPYTTLFRSLSYSGALLLSVTVFEFLPKVYRDFSPTIGLLIMGGILLQVFLEFMSKGAEHGHTHYDKTLKSFPVLLFVSLCIHSFMEGFPIAESTHLLLG